MASTMNSNNIKDAQNIINSIGNAKVKVIKKDAGLIEREDNCDEKVILTEDNRQILFG